MLQYTGNLTPINQGIERQTPGFKAMIGAVQGVAGRILANQKLAEERKYEAQKETLKFQREMYMVDYKAASDLTKDMEVEKFRARRSMAEIGARHTAEMEQIKFREGLDREWDVSPMRIQAAAQEAGMTTSAREYASMPFRDREASRDAVNRAAQMNASAARENAKYAGIEGYVPMVWSATESGTVTLVDPASGQPINTAQWEMANKNVFAANEIANMYEAQLGRLENADEVSEWIGNVRSGTESPANRPALIFKTQEGDSKGKSQEAGMYSMAFSYTKAENLVNGRSAAQRALVESGYKPMTEAPHMDPMFASTDEKAIANNIRENFDTVYGAYEKMAELKDYYLDQKKSTFDPAFATTFKNLNDLAQAHRSGTQDLSRLYFNPYYMPGDRNNDEPFVTADRLAKIITEKRRTQAPTAYQTTSSYVTHQDRALGLF